MSDLSLWATRYQFTQELWAGAARLLVDPALERSLGRGEPLEDSLADMVERLFNEGEREAPPVWMGLERGRRSAEYARRFDGVVFDELREMPALAAEEDWQVAIVDLSGLVAASSHADAARLESRLSPAMAATLETLAERCQEGRRVVLSVPSREQSGARGVSVERFAEFVDAHFEGARMYALAPAPMVGIYELDQAQEDDDTELEDEDEFEAQDDGPALRARGRLDDYDADLDAAEATWSQGAGPATQVQRSLDDAPDSPDLSDEPPIDLDMSLGSAEPRFFTYLAVISPVDDIQVAQGTTYVELPTPMAAAEGHGDGESRAGEGGAQSSALRAQLAQAQRQAELLALEKQSVFEELEAARDRIDALEDGELSADPDAEADDGRARLDAALTQAQELRWRVRELEGLNAELLARPVEALEAQNASLRAEAKAQLANASASESEASDEAREAPESSAGDAERGVRGAPDASGGRWMGELVSRVDRLLRRVERGGLSALELHGSLRKLRERLTRKR